MANVTATKNIETLPLSSGNNTITVTTKAYTTYNLEESEPSMQLYLSAGECAFAQLEDGTWALSGRGTMTGGNITIPSTYAGKPVTQISSQAFYEDDGLFEVTIPASIQHIGAQAFRGSALTNIKFEDIDHAVIFFRKPSTWTTPYVYYTCYSGASNELGEMMDLFDASQNLYSCKVPLDVWTISFISEDEKYKTNVWDYGEAGLMGQNELFAIRPNGTLWCSPFYNPGENFVIYDGLKIDNSAFQDCTGLTTINFPRRVTSVDYAAFKGCTSLRNISNLPCSRLVKIGGDAFQGCTGLTTIQIYNGIKEISENAFHGCTQLSNARFGGEIGGSLEKIGAYAFYNCVALHVFTIPDSVTRIDPQAFAIPTAAEEGFVRGVKFANAYTWFTADRAALGQQTISTLIPPASIYVEGEPDAVNIGFLYNGRILTFDKKGYYWHRLSQMIPPDVYVRSSDNTLVMTDTLGVAEEFNIYINGEKKATVYNNPK